VFTVTRRYSVELIWVLLLVVMFLFIPKDARSDHPMYWAVDSAGFCPDGPDDDCGFER